MNRSKTNQSRFWRKWKKSGALGHLFYGESKPLVESKLARQREAAHKEAFVQEFSDFLGDSGTRIHSNRYGYLDMDNREHRALMDG